MKALTILTILFLVLTAGCQASAPVVVDTQEPENTLAPTQTAAVIESVSQKRTETSTEASAWHLDGCTCRQCLWPDSSFPLPARPPGHEPVIPRFCQRITYSTCCQLVHDRDSAQVYSRN